MDISIRKQLIKLSKFGHQLLKRHYYAEAGQIFEEALRLAPDNIYFMTRLGDSLRRQNEFSAAADCYRRVLEIAPDNQFALRGFGDAMRGLQLYGDAIALWIKYLHLKNFRNVPVLTRVAGCYKALNNYEEAKSYYQKALSLNPNNRYALIGLADLYHKQGYELPAIEFYEKALANGVILINILTIVGNLHYRQGLGSYEAAESAYKYNLEKNYDLFSTVGMIKLRLLQARLKEACDFYDELLRNEGEDKKVFADVGRLLILRNEHGLALQFFRHVQQRQNKNPSVSRIIGDRIKELEAISG